MIGRLDQESVNIFADNALNGRVALITLKEDLEIDNKDCAQVHESIQQK